MMDDINPAPNPADFSVNTREGEFDVCVRFIGTLRFTVEAASRAEAEDEAQRMIDAHEIEPGPDHLEQIDIDYVRACRALYRVDRDGTPWQVSHLLPGDLPRDPDERGF